MLVYVNGQEYILISFILAVCGALLTILIYEFRGGKAFKESIAVLFLNYKLKLEKTSSLVIVESLMHVLHEQSAKLGIHRRAVSAFQKKSFNQLMALGLADSVDDDLNDTIGEGSDTYLIRFDVLEKRKRELLKNQIKKSGWLNEQAK
ncbi:MAG: hypothetical protein V4501_08250 [Pseudomonadota bacterium]